VKSARTAVVMDRAIAGAPLVKIRGVPPRRYRTAWYRLS
jgi:hypothetical protein